MLGVVQLPYTLMRVSIGATAAAGPVVGAGVVAIPAVTAGAGGADAVPRSAVGLVWGAVELATPPHPADVTTKQAPALAATTISSPGGGRG